MNSLTRSTCCYCGVGCGVVIETRTPGAGEEPPMIVGVQGDSEHPANWGRLCTKGSTLHLTASPTVYAQTRVSRPQLRTNRDEPRRDVSWTVALDHTAQRLAEIINTHGPDAVGFYVSGQLLTEDYFVFNKLAKGLVGTNNIDTNSRLCMSSAVAGYKQTLGADAPPCSYEDLDHAQTLFISGSNMAYAHPVLFRRIERAREKNPLMKIIVVDPRVTDTARSADLHLQIQPGTDVALYHGMLHIMLWERWVDEGYVASHTEGFDELRRLAHEFSPKAVAQICGISETDLRQAALWFANSKATLSLYCQGLNQSAAGTAKNAALINLHLATAQIGKPGAGPFSLTGQPNAMGGREVGGLSNQLAAHRDLSNAAHRAEVAALWGVRSVPERPGLSAVPMFEALRSGQLKAVWIVCTNPAQSLPHQTAVREALERAELVIVQEAFNNTATVPYADVLLPATTWAEKDGTVTNSERRISRVRPALPPYAESKHDWQIAVAVGRRLQSLLPERTDSPGRDLFDYVSPESIWNDHRELTRGMDLDITGLSYEWLESRGPTQWPLPEGGTTGQTRLYEDGRFPTPSGKARFAATPYRGVAEAVDARYPFALTTGRLRDQWHGMSRTGSVARLHAHAPEPSVQICARDAERLNLKRGDLVHVASRRASIVLPVEVSEEVGAGQAFIAMHWGQEHVSGRAAHSVAYGVNSLTSPAIDPVSEQPELKHAAVKLIKAELPWRLTAFAWLAAKEVLNVQARLREIGRQAAYASLTLFGRESDTVQAHDAQALGLMLQLADYEPCAPQLRDWIAAQFNLLDGRRNQHLLQYEDKRKGTRRMIQVEVDGQRADSGRVVAALLVGKDTDMGPATWLRDFLESGVDVRAQGRMLLSSAEQPPVGAPARGKVVCNCFNISAASLTEQLDKMGPVGTPEQVLACLQSTLKCGTNCGSCLPEIKTLIKQHALISSGSVTANASADAV